VKEVGARVRTGIIKRRPEAFMLPQHGYELTRLTASGQPPSTVYSWVDTCTASSTAAAAWTQQRKPCLKHMIVYVPAEEGLGAPVANEDVSCVGWPWSGPDSVGRGYKLVLLAATVVGVNRLAATEHELCVSTQRCRRAVPSHWSHRPSHRPSHLTPLPWQLLLRTIVPDVPVFD
jgi:hypothetical protein